MRWVHLPRRYPEQLEWRLGVRIANAGIWGERTEDMRARLQGLLAEETDGQLRAVLPAPAARHAGHRRREKDASSTI